MYVNTFTCLCLYVRLLTYFRYLFFITSVGGVVMKELALLTQVFVLSVSGHSSVCADKYREMCYYLDKKNSTSVLNISVCTESFVGI
jgi:hypothetical protein